MPGGSSRLGPPRDLGGSTRLAPAFVLVEIVFGVVVDDEVENRALRKGCGFVQLEPSVFDSCS